MQGHLNVKFFMLWIHVHQVPNTSLSQALKIITINLKSLNFSDEKAYEQRLSKTSPITTINQMS